MKNFIGTLLFIFVIVFIFSNGAFAQNMEDAYRLSYHGLGFGARSLGLGTAYTAVANDFSAVYWNPAGLGEVRSNEFSIGLSHNSFRNSNLFLGENINFNNSATNLNGLGIVYPFPVRRGSLVFAIGYNKQSDFHTALAFNGFNLKNVTNSYPDNVDINTTVLENGGLNNWVIGGAIEAAKGLFLGASLNIISGSYTYNRDYVGKDIKDIYKFEEINRTYDIDEDIGGVTGNLGFLYFIRDINAKIGFNVKLPSYFSVRDDWSDIENYYHDIPDSDYVIKDYFRSEFEVFSPFIFGVGFSWKYDDLLFTGSADLTDWTQMEFRDEYGDFNNENLKIKSDLQATINLRTGIELTIPRTTIQARVGLAYLPSPYIIDKFANDKKFITGGLGWVIENSVRFDIGYAYGFWETNHKVYFDHPYYFVTSENINSHNLIATLSYRF